MFLIHAAAADNQGKRDEVMSTPANKKRRVITLQTKKAIIEASGNKNSVQLSKEFDLAPSTIRTILAGKASILGAINEGNSTKRVRMKRAKNVDLEEGVMRWVKTVRSQNISLTGPLLKEKAKELAKELAKPLRKTLRTEQRPLDANKAELEKKADKLDRFRASDGWLDKFKQRHSIVFRSNQVEKGASDIDLGALNDGHWQQGVLQAAIAQFSPNEMLTNTKSHLQRSWEAVTPETLDNCFLNGGFLINEQVVKQELEDGVEDEETTPWAYLQTDNEMEGDLEDYLAGDEGRALTLAEIAEGCLTTEVENANEESETGVLEMDEKPELSAVTTTPREAKEALRIVRRYLETNIADNSVLRMCDKLNDVLAEECFKKTNLNYFTPNQ